MSGKRVPFFSIVLIFTAISLLGWVFVPLLSFRLQPSAGLASFTITSTWGSTSAIIVEGQLTSQLEAAINTLKGIKNISSVSSPGYSKIDIEIDKYTDPNQLRLEMSAVIRRLYPSLPVGVSYPSINLSTPDEEDEKPLLIYTLFGSHDSEILQEYVENYLKTDLALIAGIEKIIVYGGIGNEWQVIYQPETINRLSITPEDITQALKLFFHHQPIGHVIEYEQGENRRTEKKMSVKLALQSSMNIQWENIPVKKAGNRIIYLGEIARIERVKQEANSYFRVNGKNAINLVIYPEKGSNALKLATLIRGKIIQMKSVLPDAYVLETSYDSTEYVSNELSKIYKRTLLTFFILMVFVFLVSLSFRYVLLIVLSLFTNLSLSFIFYYLLGIEIHLYSLAGITVSLGLIIDNSIVMTDHLIYRKNLKVYTALLASTLTTMVSLIVVWFLPEELRLNLWDFALIIVVNLSVSLAVSLFYIPALLKMMPMNMGKQIKKRRRRGMIVWMNSYYAAFITFLLRYRTAAILVLVLAFGLPVFMLPNKIQSEGMWPNIYNRTLGSEWYTDHLKTHVNKYLGGSLRLFSYYVFENSYYTKPEETKLYVQASMPKGSTIGQLNSVMVEMEKFVAQYGNTIQYYSRIYGPQYAEMTITFNNQTSDNVFPYLLKSRLIARSIDLGGINWNIYGIGKGFSNNFGVSEMINFKVAMYGFNFDELEIQAKRLQAKLDVHPRVKKVNVSGGKYWWEDEKSYEYYINVNNDRMDYGKNTLTDVYREFRNKTSTSGNRIGLFTGHSYDYIHLTPDNRGLTDKWGLINQPMASSGHKLMEYVSIARGIEQQSIYKENQNYIRIVDFQYIGSTKFGNEFLAEVLNEMKSEMPIGYRVESLLNYYNSKEETVSYTWLILLVTIIIFIICSILFESLLRPFAIILTVPASFIGVFLTFYLLDFNFDQGGFASFVLITGLVVNSSIYLLNEFDHITGKKRNLMDPKRYVKAFNRKIVPILLTIGSTVMGLIPFMAFGQNEPFWFAMAAGTSGGLIFSIVVILVYLPLFVLKRKQLV